jgi:PAS domain S-box-containing protein
LSPFTLATAQVKIWLKSTGNNLDGVVCKQRNSPYVSGVSPAFRKVKNYRSIDCVIGGFRYTEDGKGVASLLLGLYDDEGKLNHVGFTSGLKGAERVRLAKRLKKLISPPGFDGNAPGGKSRWAPAGSREWKPLKPELVVEVCYDHFTGGRFRHGTRLLRWRPDKAPLQCRYQQLPKPSEELFGGVALSEIVKIHPEWLNKAHAGDFIPITVHLCGAGGTIGGHAALGRNNQVFLMISKSIKLDSEFEVGAAVGKELEQQKIRDYVHEQLAPEFMSAVFTLDSVRLQLEKENHPCAARLKHIQERFTQPLLHLREELGRGAAERHEFYLVTRRLAAIVENSDDAIIGKDLDGVITSWNRGAERIFGFSAEEMIGTSIRRIIPPERQEEEEEILDRLRRDQHIDHFETVRIAKDGRRIYVSLTVSPIKDETGRVVGASKIARDIGERKPREAKNKLESASEEAAPLATRASGIDQLAGPRTSATTRKIKKVE